jgi:hypothetical protein
MRPPEATPLRDAHPRTKSPQLGSPHQSLLPIFAKRKSGEDRTRAGTPASRRGGAKYHALRVAPSTGEDVPSTCGA